MKLCIVFYKVRGKINYKIVLKESTKKMRVFIVKNITPCTERYWSPSNDIENCVHLDFTLQFYVIFTLKTNHSDA